MQLVPGTLVDRYRVEAELGRGGMARVYRVRHKSLDTLHALKVLTLGGEELRERLLREGRLQSRLDHPHIVPVRDVLDLEQGPGLLMDFIDGPSLDRWLVEQHPDLEDRERIFLEIVEGVAFAHAQGVIHRDLKPGNVMMELKRGVWHPRVADFGLAKLVDGEDEAGPLQSRTGRPMGTPAYMAPEQVRSAKHVDQRADVFALGCILYELMCGRRAFVGDDTLEVFNRVTQGRYLPPRDAAAGLPQRVEAAIFGALAVLPDERIPDCETLVGVLRGERAWALPPRADATMDGASWSDADLAALGPPPAPVTMDPASLAITGRAEAAASPASPPAPAAPAAQVAPAPAPPPARGYAPLAWLAAGTVAIAVILAASAGFGVGLLRPTTPAAVSTPAAPPQPPVPPAPPETPEVPDAPTAPTPPTPPVLATPAAPPAAPRAPVAPRAPTPPATPAPPAPPATPTPPSPRTGAARVTVRGDARLVRLRNASGAQLEPGELPAGSYLIEAAFDAGPPMHAGNLVLTAGQSVTLDCRADTLSCTP